jgi:hypothetical protein
MPVAPRAIERVPVLDFVAPNRALLPLIVP